ncbi:MAG: zinc ribbon domain-containing protein [Coriobacteriia bacterium]|nr:zinc ribbon domain-containing protein [Coriobacteriia bacterium]
MANDLFGGLGALGDLVGGIAKSVVPQDSPEGKLLQSSSALADLKKQETELLAEIGRTAFEASPGSYPQADKLKLIQQNIASAQAELDEAQQAAEQAQAAQAAEDAVGRCPGCGSKNPEGVKFCQECGSALGVKTCNACGVELEPGTRFCGACGAAQGG